MPRCCAPAPATADRLTPARIAYDAAELELTQDALVHSFHRLARDVDEVIKAARCQR